jgi:hypothetical protein
MARLPAVLAALGASIGLYLVVALLVRRIAAGRVRAWLPPTDSVAVRVGGFPILRGPVRWRVHTVRLVARGVVTEGVRLDELRVEAHGVAVRRARGSIDVLRGFGLIGYPALSAAAPGITFSPGENGTLRMTAGIGGVRASATARPSIGEDLLRLDPEMLVGPFGTGVPLDVLPAVTYRLRELPVGLDFDLHPTARGLELFFRGTGVTVRQVDRLSSRSPAPSSRRRRPGRRRCS